MLRAVPLLALIVIAYDVMAVAAPAALAGPVLGFALPSGAPWRLAGGELLLAVGLILLYVEIFKSTRTSQASIIDHVLSLVVFVVCIVEFLVWSPAGTGVFFVITLMVLIDVIAGFTVTITSARRDFGVDREGLG
jgi:hypothetical protein